MPEELLRQLLVARTFNQGFATVEYVSSALVDLDLHSQATADGFDVGAFEQASLDRIGMPAEIVMRHRPPHFAHVFSGGGYASAYYSYMWSEVLDADAFAAFEETGDIFDPATAKKLHDNVYAAGGSRDPAELYTAFRGRLPTPDALLKQRGLVDRRRPHERHGPPHRRTPPRRRLRAASLPPSRPAARCWPKAATRSRPWWRWRRRSPRSIRT